MCSEQWLKADIKFSETVQTNEQLLAEVEQLDKLEKCMFIYLSLLTYRYIVSSLTFCFVFRFRVWECEN